MKYFRRRRRGSGHRIDSYTYGKAVPLFDDVESRIRSRIRPKVETSEFFFGSPFKTRLALTCGNANLYDKSFYSDSLLNDKFNILYIIIL